MSTLHLTNGDVAAESLRIALRQAGRNDRVQALRDDLAVGPLLGSDTAPYLRAEFWQRVLGDARRDCVREFDEQADVLAEIAAQPSPVIVWHAQSAGDQLMLRRVCYHLRDCPQRLHEVRLTIGALTGSGAPRRADHATSIGMFAPDLLKARLADAAPIPLLRIGRLAVEWQTLKQANAEIRRWHDNMFASGSYAQLDAIILEHAASSWQPAARVAAKLMTADTGLLVSDVIALWRLRELAASGRLRLRGDTAAAWQTLELSAVDDAPRGSLSPA
jgi:Domain of unknown function (DUF1835)/Protein of unknown function